MTKKLKFSFFIEKKNKHMLKALSKDSKRSMGELINSLIEQKLSNPIDRIDYELRKLAQRINTLQNKKKLLESDD